MLFDPAVRILFTENIEKLGMASIYISFKNTFTPQKNTKNRGENDSWKEGRGNDILR